MISNLLGLVAWSAYTYVQGMLGMVEMAGEMGKIMERVRNREEEGDSVIFVHTGRDLERLEHDALESPTHQ